MSLTKCPINDLSVKVLEYPEMTIPEQGLQTKEIDTQDFLCYMQNETKQPHARRGVWSCDSLATLNFLFCHAQSILLI